VFSAAEYDVVRRFGPDIRRRCGGVASSLLTIQYDRQCPTAKIQVPQAPALPAPSSSLETIVERTDPRSDRALSSSLPSADGIRGNGNRSSAASPPNLGFFGRADEIKPADLGYSFLIEATLICRQAIGRAEPHSPIPMDDETECSAAVITSHRPEMQRSAFHGKTPKILRPSDK
jgi:hypothetical protein